METNQQEPDYEQLIRTGWQGGHATLLQLQGIPRQLPENQMAKIARR
jgi:hypothetical protein